ncbi:MAG: class I SAM-dependent methyltransferase [Limisphaerales bacterium]
MSKEANWQPKHIPYEIDPNNRNHYYENFWKHKALQLVLQHYPAHQNKTVLDYGCGRGETVKIFGDAGFKVFGTDTDPTCVQLAQMHGPAELLNVADPVGQFGRKTFDVVASFHVLEHVENPKKTLTDMSEIARDLVLLAVPNLRYLHRLFYRQINLELVNEGHLQAWDHWHLRNLAERHCGLKLIAWGFDATILPGLSNVAVKLFGDKRAIALETGLFRRIFPFHGISVIGLFAPDKRA